MPLLGLDEGQAEIRDATTIHHAATPSFDLSYGELNLIPGKPEITYLDVAVPRNEYVLRLEVPATK